MTVRCPDCRTRRATFVSMLKHVAETGHKHCGCGGYPWKHRPGSPCCEQNRLATLHRAEREQTLTDEEHLELTIDCLLGPVGKPYRGPCPF